MSRPDPKSSVAPYVRRIVSSSRFVPLLSAIAVAGVVVVASAAAMTMGPPTDTVASVVSSPTVSISPSARATDDRASRSGIRELRASPSPAPSSALGRSVPGETRGLGFERLESAEAIVEIGLGGEQRIAVGGAVE